MARAIAIASLTALLAAGAFAQAPRPAFEVASVRPSGPPLQGPRLQGILQGGPGANDPERITDSRVTLQRLLCLAYGVHFDQVRGPGWIAEEKYNIAAKVPPGATQDQFKLMLQDLLAERFKLTLHHITKEFPVYELTIAKGGSKLRENTGALEPSRPGDLELPPDRDGYPRIPPGKSASAGAVVKGLYRTTSQGMPLSLLLSQVGDQLGAMTGADTFAPARIIDKTGLTGKYDFKMEYVSGIGGALSLPAAPAGAEPTGGLTLIDAMEKQLGLKLTKTTAPYDVLVIDHAEKIPTGN